MLIIKNHGFKRRYVYGGSGIFDSLTHFITNLFSSNVAKQLAATTLDVGRQAAEEVGKKAVDVGKSVAINASKKLVEKGIKKFLTPKNQVILTKYATQNKIPPNDINTQTLTPKAHTILSKYINAGAQNINNLIDGSGCSNAIAIQDLVKKLNGSGLKVI